MAILNPNDLNEALNRNYRPGDEVADIILSQLGGNRFLGMTGCRELIRTDSTVTFSITRNATKANRMLISYRKARDIYNVKFYRVTAARFSTKTGMFYPEKVTVVSEHEDIYCNELADLFERVTGLYTHF